MKKQRNFLLIILAAAILLSACNNKSSENGLTSDISGAAQKIEDYTPKPDKKYQVTMGIWQYGAVEPNAEMITYWNQKYNVDIVPMNIERQRFSEILNLKLASGEIPDFIRIVNRETLNKYVKQDVLAELPVEAVEKFAPTLYKEYTEADPIVFNTVSVDDKNYSMPSLLYHNKFRAPVIYRGDWMKKVGVEKAPETFEEFETLMYKFADEDPDSSGKKDTFGMANSGLNVVFGSYGYFPADWLNNDDFGAWSVRDGKLVFDSVQPEMKQALATLNKWHNDGVLDPEFITLESPSNRNRSDSFINGRIGLTCIGAYYTWKPQFYEGDFTGLNLQEMENVDKETANNLVLEIGRAHV